MDSQSPTTGAPGGKTLSACEPSTLSIPNDPFYVEPACRYVAQVALQIGFEPDLTRQIVEGLRRALTALLRYSFEPNESAAVELSSERVPAGIRLALRDRGLPLDRRAAEPGGPPPGNPLHGLNDYFDDVRFHNRGRDGKELVLCKHLPDPSLVDFAAACGLPSPDAAPDARPPMQTPGRCSVRLLNPSEAHEVSKAVYKTYGYSYPHDFVYYPEKIVEFNRSGRIISAVAESASGEIAGHCSLQLWEENPRIAELTQGVVIPQFRSQGCFARLTEYLVDIARARGLTAVFGEAVTAHPYSQRVALHFGLRECALFLGMIPASADFKGLGGRGAGRGSMLVQFRPLQPMPPGPVYAPPAHRAVIAAAYANLGLSPEWGSPGTGAGELPAGDGSLAITLNRALGLARIRFDRWGRGSIDALRRHVDALCRSNWEVIHLLLGLSDPAPAHACARLEALGFFFAGVLPGGLPGGDALILQHLNGRDGRYETIHTASAFGAELVAYVRARDPNQRT